VTRPLPVLQVDELLDQAVQAINRGDRETSNALASKVLAVDRTNTDAEELLAAPSSPGEIRRLTILFADLVDSTALSTRVEPEVYRTVVGRYRERATVTVEGYEGHVSFNQGDGMLAVFGHPTAHENDVLRAVQAGLDITEAVAELSQRVRRRFGFDIDVRVGIHRGIVYLDLAQDDVFGLAANLTARMCSLADPGTVMVSDAIEPLIRTGFELEARLPKPVKGIEGLISHFRVVGERDTTDFTLGPLVGRREELAYLEKTWAAARRGELEIPGVVLKGDAGIGKSRLAWAAVDLATRSHAVILQLVGSPFHTDVGLRPVRRLLERRSGITRTSDPPESLHHLEAEIRNRGIDPAVAVPLLAPVLGIDAHHGYHAVQADGRALYEKIRGAVHDYLLACVRDGPALVLVEDMHWFDEDSMEVIEALLEHDLGGHVLVVMTGRDSESLPDSQHAKTFHLGALSDDESDKLIVALHPDMPADARRAVRRRCDGVPLYIEEVVAKLKEQPTDAAESPRVPDTLYEALFARIRSSTDAVPVVEAAAVLGTRVERGLLVAVVDLSEDTVDRVIGELTEGRVLEALDESSWRFRHELLREVAAELSPPSVRRRLHGRVADTLMNTGSEANPDWPLIASHYERADRYMEAANAYREASEDARLRGALVEARTYLSHAVSQVERAEPNAERDHLEVALRLQRGFLAYAAEGASSPNAAADYTRCLEVSSSHGLEDDEFFATLVALYGYYAMRADLDRAERLLSSVRTSLLGRREWFLPFNDAGFGMLAWYRGEFTKARDLLEAAATARSDESASELEAVWFMPNEGTASIYTHLALARFVQGDLTGAEAELRRTESRCEGLTFPQGVFSWAYACQMEVMINIEAGRLDRAMQIATALSDNGTEHGFDSWALTGAAQQSTVSALVALTKDTVDAAELQIHIATVGSYIEAWRAFGVRSLITFYDAVLARLLIAGGDTAAARDRIETALALADETTMRFYDAELLRIRAQTTDDPQAQQADLRAAIELAGKQGANILHIRAAAEYFAHCPQEGRSVLADAVSRFPSDSSWPELVRARTLLA
jgi:class 3 adenylate cyclase/DNA-binding transcriptional ArsR family regulator